MNSFFRILCCVSVALAFSGMSSAEESVFSWPEMERQHRPWTYWYWMGSAVDEQNISSQLETFQEGGLGGVHIIPIYGAKGAEHRYIDYLSPQWMAMLDHSVREADRLGMGVDMTTGTGWCFGGPQISDHLANARISPKFFPLKSGGPIKREFPHEYATLMAFCDDGKVVDLTAQLQADGSIPWQVPEGDWQLLALRRIVGRKVKRAAPGGEGYMINTFYIRAMERFLQDFSEAFETYNGPLPRSMYHDSYEYQCDWSPNLLAEFESRRGYRIQEQLPYLFGDDEKAGRLRADYNRTLSELMLSDFLQPWVEWCHQRGMITRNEAHGSPGNLIDLYAVADVPETEMFRQDRDPLVAKFSSSAAHVVGRKLVSCETGTWIRDHFNVTLEDLKLLADELFVSGVNHLIYHGNCYSPEDAAWPGWLFYASTQMNPRNSFWKDVPTLNGYIARCQSILQETQPDNDVLLYWPIEDFWHSHKRLAPMLTVHHTEWLREQAIGTSARGLWEEGFAFDYVSDLVLQDTGVNELRRVVTEGSSYQVLVIPPCQHMPLATLQRMLDLARQGATVIFEENLPSDVPGFHNLEERRAELAGLLSPLKKEAESGSQGAYSVPFGEGTVWIGRLDQCLQSAKVSREPMVDRGLEFIRREGKTGKVYFITNLGDEKVDDWVTLSQPAKSVLLMDPMTSATGLGRIKSSASSKTELLLQLEPGESRILRLLTESTSGAANWDYRAPTDEETKLRGDWRIEFIDGGPVLPKKISTNQLKSWTDLGDADTKRFSGTARYSHVFDVPNGSTGLWRLDLRECRHSARVKLNGQQIGTLIGKPYHIDLPEELLRSEANVLEIEVTNLSANRIADLDRRKVDWKIFHDINFVSIDYDPFDASNWEVRSSGILGPVTLRRMKSLSDDQDVSP